MTSRTDPAVAADADRASAPESVLWHHAAFCRLALPVEPGVQAWRREGVDAVIRIAPGAAGETLPDGPGLRLLLAFLCDSALRAGGATVALGADAAALAARMGLSEGAAAPLAEQMDRILGARITASIDGGPELAVLDARSRPRGGGWPAQVKLNARFLASLESGAVPLDRGIHRALSASAEAMDAHAWTREALARAGTEATVTTPWPELQARFGAPGATAEAFREAFEGALRLVFEADLSIELAVDDDGVSVRWAQAQEGSAPAEAAAPVTPVPAAPVPAPAPEVPLPTPAAAPVPVAPTAPPHVAAAAEEARPREDRHRDERAQDDRPRDDRPRHERPRDERIRDERPRDERIRDERPREERQREDRGRDDRRRRDEGGDSGADAIVDDMIRLRSHLTGLPQVVWLRRGHGDENILVGITPGTRMDTDRLTVLMVEPIVMQVSGGLGQNDFDRVSAWVMANRDLIDEFWEGTIASAEEVNSRVRKAPGPTWR